MRSVLQINRPFPSLSRIQQVAHRNVQRFTLQEIKPNHGFKKRRKLLSFPLFDMQLNLPSDFLYQYT